MHQNICCWPFVTRNAFRFCRTLIWSARAAHGLIGETMLAAGIEFYWTSCTMPLYARGLSRGPDATRPTICTSGRRLARCRLDRGAKCGKTCEARITVTRGADVCETLFVCLSLRRQLLQTLARPTLWKTPPV